MDLESAINVYTNIYSIIRRRRRFIKNYLINTIIYYTILYNTIRNSGSDADPAVGQQHLSSRC